MPFEHLPDGRMRMFPGDYDLPWMKQETEQMSSDSKEWADHVASHYPGHVWEKDWNHARNPLDQPEEPQSLALVQDSLDAACKEAEEVLKLLVTLDEHLFGPDTQCLSPGDRRELPGVIGGLTDAVDILRDTLACISRRVRHIGSAF